MFFSIILGGFPDPGFSATGIK